MVKPFVIQIIEDRAEFAAGIKAVLELEGYIVHVHGTATQGIAFASVTPPDLVILDLILPDMHGTEAVQTLRTVAPRIPVMILSACADEVDKIVSFQAGADDYVTKPFSLMELLARIGALLRRRATASDATAAPGARLRVGSRVELDLRQHAVYKDGRAVHLTPKEFDLLAALVAARGAVLSRRQIVEVVWRRQLAAKSRTVDAHIFELRQKLEDDPSHPTLIITVHDRGFRVILEQKGPGARR
ncbi:MAG: response regulator transcription factor [Gemmatimonadaceae bacterium]|nr:response regulator transcription factor [Gemmatimonadaceae bacterium]NUQ93086.1 response regulator transcription factor [Gemmatimonadaceae bacterium]NUR18478.1 response regulator transcription factor [Gemmatimonadaceae bacterium]NUS95931.1 response regulator transcription factor [Gemmatimonadaceae bacterium]